MPITPAKPSQPREISSKIMAKVVVVDLRAAVFLGNVQPEQPHLLHLADQRVRIFVAMLHRGSDRHHFLVDELPDGADDQLLLGCSTASRGFSEGRRRHHDTPLQAQDGFSPLVDPAAF